MVFSGLDMIRDHSTNNHSSCGEKSIRNRSVRFPTTLQMGLSAVVHTDVVEMNVLSAVERGTSSHSPKTFVRTSSHAMWKQRVQLPRY